MQTWSFKTTEIYSLPVLEARFPSLAVQLPQPCRRVLRAPAGGWRPSLALTGIIQPLPPSSHAPPPASVFPPCLFLSRRTFVMEFSSLLSGMVSPHDSSPWFHLQRPLFKIRPHSEVLGVRTWLSVLGGHSFTQDSLSLGFPNLCLFHEPNTFTPHQFTINECWLVREEF